MMLSPVCSLLASSLLPVCTVACYVLSARFIHRLDYATSGCLCIALSKKAARWGNKAFAKRYVAKHYLALVCQLVLTLAFLLS